MKVSRFKTMAAGVLVIGSILISGCASEPGLTDSQSLEYLNIYKDNLVVLRASSQYTNPSYSINNANQVVAYKLFKPGVGQIYLNAVDIAQLRSVGIPNAEVSVTLRNGEKFKSFFATIYLCDTLKKCKAYNESTRVPLTTYSEGTLFGNEISEKLDEYPAYPSSTFNFNKNSVQYINFSSGVEAAKFNNETIPQGRVRLKERFDARSAKLKKENETYRKMGIEAEETAVARRQVDCISTGYSLGEAMANYSNQTLISCEGGRFRSSVGLMREKGWSVANVRTIVVPYIVGTPAHTEHSFVFTR